MTDYNKQIMEYLRALLEVAIEKCPEDSNRSVWLNGRTLDDIKTAYEEFTNYVMNKEIIDKRYAKNDNCSML